MSRCDNWLANELAQQASGYHVSRGVFFISEKPMLAFACSEKASLHMADLPAKSADDEVPLDGEFLGGKFLGGSDWRMPIITYL